MAKLPLNGIIAEVNDIEYVGQNNFAKQSFILFIPGYTDEYGEKKGKDEHWKIEILGESIDKFNLHNRHVNSKVKIEVYIKSSKYENKEGKIVYITNINLASIQFVQERQPGNSQTPAAPAVNNLLATAPIITAPIPPDNGPDDDDLPF